MKLYHFSGAGNNFVVLDGRAADMAPYRDVSRIVNLCRRLRTDGLMILTLPTAAASRMGGGRRNPCLPPKDRMRGDFSESRLGFDCLPPEAEGCSGIDFGMEFYNPDGSGGMMCGNGGRCIAAFANYLGIPASQGQTYVFQAPDGVHTAEILDHKGPQEWTVKLRMKDVDGIEPVLGGWFLDTGTRHHVRFVENVDAVDIDVDGPRYRHDPAFAPIGANVNFVERRGEWLHVRTFEKGVEGETLACGTGITASAIAAWHAAGASPLQPVHTCIQARQDPLSVDFRPLSPTSFTDVYLTGPATLLEICDE